MAKSPSLTASAIGGRSPFGLAEFAEFWLYEPSRRITLLAWLCTVWLCFFGAQWFRVEKEVTGGRRALGITAETTYLPPGPVLRIASLGHQSFLADLVYVQAAHYFVRHLITDSQLPWLDLYLGAIWSLDANSKSSYRWGSQVVKFGQRIDREVSQRANHFARLGLEAQPDDAWLYHEIAFNLRYAMEPRSPEEAQELKALALKYLEIAYTFPNFVYDPNYLASQYARAGQVDESIKSALANYGGASEEERRELLVEHGMAGRGYTGILSNTVASFALGDYEWILALESNDLPEIVDLMRHLRSTKARLHVR